MSEAPNKIQEEYIQLHFIAYQQSEKTPVFEAYLRISNVVVKMYQKLPHMNFQTGEGPRSSNMFGLADTGAELNFGNWDYHQSVVERYSNLVLEISYLKDLDYVYPSNITGVDGGKESEQVKGGVDVTSAITYKNPFVINGQPLKFSLALVQGVTYNTIFSWPYLQKNRTIKASTMNKNNSLVCGILGEKFKMLMMVPQRSKEEPKKSEVLTVSSTVTIPERENNMEVRGIICSTVELKKKLIHQCEIPGQN